MLYIGQVLDWKFNSAPGIVTRAGEITEWPEALGARPTTEQIAKWTVECQAALDAAAQAEADKIAAKAQAIIDNLPTWAEIQGRLDTIEADIEAATTIAACKAVMKAMLVILRRLCRIVYWLAKDRAD